MFIAIALQCSAICLLALVVGGWIDWPSARSVVLGGGAAIIPNSLFAMRLAVQRGRAPESYPVVFILGEFVKIGLTIALLAAVMRYAGDLRWLWLMIGLIVALQIPLFAAFLPGTRRSRDPLE
ncbi:MAG: ATP synthase subunit I [Burkholderiaceae bacterium]